MQKKKKTHKQPTLNFYYCCVIVSQDQLEHTRRDNSGLHEGERQLQLKIKTLQNCLKSEKEEVRETQFTWSDMTTAPHHVAL